LKVPAIQIKQRDKTLYLSAMKVKEIIGYDVDRVDVKGKDGYQRPLDQNRVKQVRRYLTEGVGVFPTSVLFNIRGEVGFKSDDGSVGTLTIDDKLWLVDGQHRIGGLEEAARGAPSFAEYELPVVIMTTKTRQDEITHFYTINTEQKGVPVDVAVRHLVIEEKEKGTGIMVQKGKLDQVIAIQVSDKLALNPQSPWHEKVQMSDQPRKLPNHVINQKSLYRSLFPVARVQALRDAYLIDRDDAVDKIAELLIRYWRAVQRLCPKAFQDPDNYLVQRTTGAYVLHLLFPAIFERCKENGDLSEESFLSVLKPTGMTDIDWHRDMASKFGGMQGFRALQYQYESKLPQLKGLLKI